MSVQKRLSSYSSRGSLVTPSTPPLSSQHTPKGSSASATRPIAGKVKAFTDSLPPALAEKYALVSELAVGGFGKVYMGRRRGMEVGSASHVTIKFVVGNRDVEKDRLYDPTHGWLPREAYFMTRLSTIPNVVQLLDMATLPDRGGYCMVMETAGTEWRWVDVEKKQSKMARDLMGLIKQSGRLEYRHTHHLFRAIVDTIYRLHTRGIHHGDLKCLNVLVDDRFRIKICDFGAATERGQPGPSYFAGTRIFSPPEVLLKSKKKDPELIESWTLGVILYTMYHGTGPYRSLEDIIDPHYRPAWRVDDMEAKALCRGLMHKNVEKRFRLRDAWMHPWVGLSQPTSGSIKSATTSSTVSVKAHAL